MGMNAPLVHNLTMYENSLMFSDTGEHSMKVLNPVTRECKRKENKRWKECTTCSASRVDCQTKNSVYGRLFYGLLKDGKRRFSTG